MDSMGMSPIPTRDACAKRTYRKETESEVRCRYRKQPAASHYIFSISHPMGYRNSDRNNNLGPGNMDRNNHLGPYSLPLPDSNVQTDGVPRPRHQVKNRSKIQFSETSSPGGQSVRTPTVYVYKRLRCQNSHRGQHGDFWKMHSFHTYLFLLFIK